MSLKRNLLNKQSLLVQLLSQQLPLRCSCRRSRNSCQPQVETTVTTATEPASNYETVATAKSKADDAAKAVASETVT